MIYNTKPETIVTEKEEPLKPEELPIEFRQFLEEEKLKNRALVMADAMLEENPTLGLQEAFEKAMKLLTENPQLASGEICHNRDNEQQ